MDQRRRIMTADLGCDEGRTTGGGPDCSRGSDAALPVGANVYLMSRQFDTLGGPVAASLVLSTALAAVTTPLILVLLS